MKDKIAVFGTGSSAFSFVRSFSNLDILFYLDNAKHKQYGILNQKPILPPEVIKNTDNSKYTIVVASEFYDEISKQLVDFGLKENKDFLYMKKLLLEKTDHFIISYMKCGRTWLRYIVGSLIEEQFKITNEDRLIYTDCYKFKDNTPIITAYHDDNPHQKDANELQKSKEEYKNNKVIFMVRHPADVAVSLFYHMKFRIKKYDGDIDTFVIEKIPSIVEYFNIWFNNKNLVKEFLLVRYEDLHAQGPEELFKINKFFGFKEISKETAVRVIENSSFKSMKKYEMETKSDNTQLNKYLAKTENAAKVRKGKTKGYLEELKTDTINQIDTYIKENLNPFYGY